MNVKENKIENIKLDSPIAEQKELLEVNFSEGPIWSFGLSAIPEIKSERLILNEIEEDDIESYNKIVLDKELNKLWGYDDVGGLGEDVKRESFFNVAKEDFAAGETVNFAVRLEPGGAMIGEAVLYDFDHKGVGELGCRIDSSFAGNGYGAEAFGAVVKWALASGFLHKVVAKCYKANISSYKMIEKSMEKIGEDETFYYFQRTGEK